MIKKCEQCGKEFEAKADRYKLCSRECVNAWLKGRHKRPKKNPKYSQVVYKQCEYCGKTFAVNGYKRYSTQRFCNRKCKQNASRKREEIACEWCGKLFYPYADNARYCSLSCSSKAQVNSKFDAAREEIKSRSAIRKENLKRQKQEELLEKEKQKLREKREKSKQISFVFLECKRCGSPFISMKSYAKYCCESCRKKQYNYDGYHARRIKEKAAHKENISLEVLYKRDNGTCYICGKLCRYDDYIVRDGVFIAGDYYPSIDHVVPLAAGGEHSYSNVRLAHRICNSIKSAKIITPL